MPPVAKAVDLISLLDGAAPEQTWIEPDVEPCPPASPIAIVPGVSSSTVAVMVEVLMQPGAAVVVPVTV